MYRAACPSCGAEVSFRSAGSVMAVCEYCRSTLLRDAETVRDIGKMATLLEDYSPLQIGTSGQFEGLAFTLLGRIQLRYDAGLWNEWYALFDDGRAGWLSDASGQYTLTRQAPLNEQSAPLFEKVAPGNLWRYEGESFVAADIRRARCIAGEGELPFKVGPGWEAKVIDYRHGARLLSLDWSDGTPPACYLGEIIELEALRCQLLRDEDEIRDHAGRLPGDKAALDCPSCGSSISYRAGLTPNLACPACRSVLELTAGKVEVLAKHDELERFESTLELGDEADIEGQQWTVLGLARWRELGEDADPPWTEYLLFRAGNGFRWLVETVDGWEDVRVLERWPEQFDTRRVDFGGKRLSKRYTYDAEAIFVAGAFNWRLTVGDRVSLTTFGDDEESLMLERSDSELGWSHAKAVDEAQVMEWFGRPVPLRVRSHEGSSAKRLAAVFTGILLLLNLPLLFFGEASMLPIFFGLVALWMPVLKENEAG